MRDIFALYSKFWGNITQIFRFMIRKIYWNTIMTKISYIEVLFT